ncbi:MAG: Crp/Fnr family transcriptional regulator [Acidimicrobiales bacterium]
MDPRAALAASELLGAVDEEAATRLAGAARVRSLRRHDVVYTEGSRATELYVVMAGRIAIARRAPGGRRTVTALVGAGEVFGEVGLLDDGDRPAEARALEPAQVLALGYEAVRAELDRRPRLLWDVVRILARRLRAADAALAEVRALDVTARTARRLLELAGDADEMVLPVTQEELADLVGASRERVNKAIASFVRQRWLARVDRHYRILDRAQLARRAR